MSVHIDSEFEGGNIEVVDARDPERIRLRVRPDGGTSYLQWFYFRVCGAKGVQCRMTLENAADAYVGGWEGYRVVASIDRQTWFRVDTILDDEGLVITHTPKTASTWFAYFAPYSLERHHDLVARALAAGADLEVVGASVDGRNIDVLTLGAPSSSLSLWIIGRQHPGEAMASWWMEGFIDRLIDCSDLSVRDLLQRASLRIVPMMNPDGVARGRLRTNAAGVDLNRAWANPDPIRAPEVQAVRRRMIETIPDLCLDVHGSEDVRHVFIVPPEGVRGQSGAIAELTGKFKQALLGANDDFQTAEGFPPVAPEEADLSICGNWLAETLGVLAVTLEMPFADTTHSPDPLLGWSPARAQQLGRDTIEALTAIMPTLSATQAARRSER
jgi:murein tripeptide amidase MpaA